MRQRGFGLIVDAPVLLPGLRPTDSSEPPDLRVLFDDTLDTSFWETGAWRGGRRQPDGTEPAIQVHAPNPSLGAERLAWRFRYSDDTTFLVAPAGDEIRCAWRAPLTVEDMVTYLLGPVLGFVLRLHGTTALHASTVELGDVAVTFAADAGTGKSTTAAAFARAGYRVLSDDVSALVGDDGFSVQPSYPRIRLWPDAVSGLFGDEDALPKLTPNWDKRGFDLGDSHREKPAALAHVFLLTYDEPGGEVPRIERVDEKTALLELIRHVYAHALSDRAERARDFDVLARLVERVPVSWLYLPDDVTRLQEVIALVAAHLGAPAPRGDLEAAS